MNQVTAAVDALGEMNTIGGVFGWTVNFDRQEIDPVTKLPEYNFSRALQQLKAEQVQNTK